MPNLASAKKRVRQNDKRRARNQARRSGIKTHARKFMDALREKDVSRAEQAFRLLTQNLDQVSAKGTIHRNKAARKKSRMQQRLNELKSSGS